MKEHFALSKAQLDYLKGRKTLKNPSTEEKRIRKKAIQAWSIFVPILKSKVVDKDWKITLFQSPTPDEAQKLWNIHNKLFGLEEFLDALLETNARNTVSDETYKIKIAHTMIKKSVGYYSTRYAIYPLISQEIERFNSVIQLLEQSVSAQTEREDAIKMYQMRKTQRQPPHIERDAYYHALCMHCYYFSMGVSRTEEEAIQNLTHDEYCTYHQRFEMWKTDPDYIKNILNYDYLKIFTPKKSS